MLHNQRFQLLMMSVLLLLVCPLVLMSQSLSSGSSSGMPQPTASQGYEQNIDPYSGDLKATIPLLAIGGRGSASYTMSISFESEKISGSGMYPCCDAGLVNIYDSTSTPSKYYYNRLIRHGAGYGPGVLYATWNSFEGGFEVGAPQTFYTQRRPARLVFADSSGRKHTLQDIQEKPEQTSGPFGGLDADTVAAIYAMQLGDNGYAAAELMEALGLDYGITEFSRQMVPVVENKEPDYLKLGLATGTVTANILATGLMWEGVSFENPMAPVNGSSLRGFGPETSWGNMKKLEDHFNRHGPDFGSRTSAEYAEEASRFFQRSQMEGLPTKIDARGTIRVYEPSTNRFGSYNANGTTKTFYKPDPSMHGYPTNMDYWISQLGTLVR